MKYLAAAIAFAVIVFSYMYQWEYADNHITRVNRFTSELQQTCSIGDTYDSRSPRGWRNKNGVCK